MKRGPKLGSGKINACRSWLRDYLAPQPVLSKQVYWAAVEAGYRESMINRAASQLGVVRIKTKRGWLMEVARFERRGDERS
jgi:hypothetical protein